MLYNIAPISPIQNETMSEQTDFEQARFNMIEQQIRTWEVLDENVLDLLQIVHREDFVPQNFRQLALADLNITLANEQVMMTPKLEARLLQALNIQNNETVLEVGTGSAYLTALLARLAAKVDSIDIFADFTSTAKAKLQAHDISNVELTNCDFFKDWQADKSYDIIVLTGSVPGIQPNLGESLTIGGRLFVIVGESPVMEARLITRTGQDDWQVESLFETDLPSLIGFEKKSTFEF